MSGSISTKDDSMYWRAAGWVYRLVVETLAEATKDRDLEHELRLILERGIEDLELDWFTPEQQHAIRNGIINDVIPKVQAMDFYQPDFKPGALERLDELKTALLKDSPNHKK